MTDKKKTNLTECKICHQQVAKPCKDWEERWQTCNFKILTNASDSQSKPTSRRKHLST
jgi:hypothetical protein